MFWGAILRDNVRPLTGATLLGAGLITAGIIGACGFSSDDSAFSGVNSPEYDGGSSGTMPGDGAPSNGPVATGVVLVHAAVFPAFRLCFSNMPNQVPLPDSKTMPEANVVGVDVGSVVRIDPMVAPGDIYVIDQNTVSARPGSTDDKLCGDLICPVGQQGTTCLKPGRDYVQAGRIDEPLGQARVSVLSISGCGSDDILTNAVGISSTGCGADWDSLRGNLRSDVLTLSPDGQSTNSFLPVQLVHLAPLVELARGDGELSVSFGALGVDGGTEPFATNPELFSIDSSRELTFDKNDGGVYASHGFRIALRGTDDAGTDGGVSFVRDESLAEVQALSSSKELPTDYYKAASNYALLLLGDPRVQEKLDDGGANPAYDSRRAVHLLAVPVRDPDAGADAGPDGGDGSGQDASSP